MDFGFFMPMTYEMPEVIKCAIERITTYSTKENNFAAMSEMLWEDLQSIKCTSCGGWFHFQEICPSQKRVNALAASTGLSAIIQGFQLSIEKRMEVEQKIAV